MKKYHLKHNGLFWDALGVSVERVSEMDIKITNLMLMVGTDEIQIPKFYSISSWI